MGEEPMDDEVIVLQYSELIDETQRIIQEDTNDIEAVKSIGRIIKSSNELAKKEQTTQQTILGSESLVLCAQIVSKQASALDTNLCNFDPSIFALGLTNFMLSSERGSGNLDWDLLGKKVSPMFKRSVPFSYMYGSFRPTELPPKEPKERQQRQKRQAERAEKKKPEQIQTVEATDEGNQKAVAHVRQCLKSELKKRRVKCISIIECVVNPHSFSQTVENIFNLAFLVRDERAAVKYDENGMPMVYLIHKEETSKQKNAKKQQCYFCITLDEWKDCVRSFNIKEAVITPMT